MCMQAARTALFHCIYGIAMLSCIMCFVKGTLYVITHLIPALEEAESSIIST